MYNLSNTKWKNDKLLNLVGAWIINMIYSCINFPEIMVKKLRKSQSPDLLIWLTTKHGVG